MTYRPPTSRATLPPICSLPLRSSLLGAAALLILGLCACDVVGSIGSAGAVRAGGSKSTAPPTYASTTSGASGATAGASNSSSGCLPQTCAALGVDCGPVGDGCGDVIACGSCPAGKTCGGGGIPYRCDGQTCGPLTCAEQGADCGTLGDGCGDMLECGACPAGTTCGGGGLPNVCG